MQWIFGTFPDGKWPWIKGNESYVEIYRIARKGNVTSTREMAAEVKGDLGFDLSPLFIVAGVISAEIVQSIRIPQSTKMH
jgi:hypothetical protein